MCLICFHGNKYSTITWQWVFRVESSLWLRCGFLGPNPTSGCVVDFQGRILVTVLNAFSGSSFINPVCAHAVFERSTEKEWHNPSGTSSDGWSDPSEQSCLGVDNSRPRRILRQQLTIIYWSMFRLHAVAQHRQRQRQRKNLKGSMKRHEERRPSLRVTELSECKLLTDRLAYSFFKIH